MKNHEATPRHKGILQLCDLNGLGSVKSFLSDVAKRQDVVRREEEHAKRVMEKVERDAIGMYAHDIKSGAGSSLELRNSEKSKVTVKQSVSKRVHANTVASFVDNGEIFVQKAGDMGQWVTTKKDIDDNQPKQSSSAEAYLREEEDTEKLSTFKIHEKVVQMDNYDEDINVPTGIPIIFKKRKTVQSSRKRME